MVNAIAIARESGELQTVLATVLLLRQPTFAPAFQMLLPEANAIDISFHHTPPIKKLEECDQTYLTMEGGFPGPLHITTGAARLLADAAGAPSGAIRQIASTH